LKFGPATMRSRARIPGTRAVSGKAPVTLDITVSRCGSEAVRAAGGSRNHHGKPARRGCAASSALDYIKIAFLARRSATIAERIMA
jgi:hypothetical protein